MFVWIKDGTSGRGGSNDGGGVVVEKLEWLVAREPLQGWLATAVALGHCLCWATTGLNALKGVKVATGNEVLGRLAQRALIPCTGRLGLTPGCYIVQGTGVPKPGGMYANKLDH